MPPACKSSTICTSCQQSTHKKSSGIPKCKRILWQARCYVCNWSDAMVTKNRKTAMKRFRAHKHDVEETFSIETQEALHNLRQEGLIPEGYTGE